MVDASFGLLLVLALVLAAEFLNGCTDAPNAIATVVSTRVLSPRQAVIVAVVFNVLGTLAGTAVAATIGKGIIRPEIVDLATVGAATCGIVLWSSLAWYLGLPTSESHALVAGLAGAGVATGGLGVLVGAGWTKVGVGLLLSSVVGFGAAFFLMVLIYRLFQRSSPSRVKHVFGRLQILSAAFMAFTHGSNDGQKFMGVFALALLLGGVLPRFEVPLWVILTCALVMGLGTAFGGWRVLRTMGLRLTKLQPVDGFAAETAAALTIELASRLGVPLSTTHTITSSILGVGATRRLSAVRWGVTRQIVVAWILTFPACAAIGYVAATLVRWA